MSSEFVDYRIGYYQRQDPFGESELTESILHCAPNLDTIARSEAIERLQEKSPDIVFITATKNREGLIGNLYMSLVRQRGDLSWKWLVVDNNSNDQTKDVIQSFKDPRIIYVNYSDREGVAFPVRNFGLNLVDCAFRGRIDSPKFFMVIDSDNCLVQDFAISELLKLRSVGFTSDKENSVLHGYSLCMSPNQPAVEPFNTGEANFPRINRVSDTFDRGLTCLASLLPIELLAYIRYPSERMFDTNGFEHKLRILCGKFGYKILGDKIPVSRIGAPGDRLINRFSGSSENFRFMGDHRATGKRAVIAIEVEEVIRKLYALGL